MLVVAAFEDGPAGGRAMAVLSRRFTAELHTRERIEIPGAEERNDAAGDFIRWAAVAGAVAGAAISMLVQYWSSTVAYPIDVGGRTAPAFIAYVPAAVAVGMFWSAFAAFLAFLWACGLPRLHHPLFDAAAHTVIAQGGSLVSIQVSGDQVETATAAALECGATSVELVGP